MTFPREPRTELRALASEYVGNNRRDIMFHQECVDNLVTLLAKVIAQKESEWAISKALVEVWDLTRHSICSDCDEVHDVAHEATKGRP